MKKVFLTLSALVAFVMSAVLKIENADVYVTGSNSRFLSTDIITEFRGQGDQINVYPFSFAEFMSVDNRHPIDAWNDYYTYGGLPHVLTLETLGVHDFDVNLSRGHVFMR